MRWHKSASLILIVLPNLCTMSTKLEELLTDHLSNISCKVNVGMLLFAVGVMGQPPPYQPHVSLLCFALIIAQILMKWN